MMAALKKRSTGKRIRIFQSTKSARQEVYTRLAREVAGAIKELSVNDPAEDVWLLYDLSGILFTIGQVDPVEGQARLNTFLNQLRTLQGPIRELCPTEGEPKRRRLRGKN